MKTFSLLFLILSFSCSLSRITEDSKDYGHAGVTNFESYDSNNDGAIDKKEFSEIKVENKDTTQPIIVMLLIIGSVGFMIMSPKIFSLAKNGVFNKD
jgi:hypothetical protein|tara:strand:- start:467 stop:757 length:291 start_codon:yes stop_codon:yes gene_type:complete